MNTWHAFARELKVFAETASSPNTTITYDANGNMTEKGNMCYEYNDANQMDKVKNCTSNQTIAEYIYDYKGQRMVKKNYSGGTLANTVISWSNSFETKDIVGGSIQTTNYYFANNELIAKKDNSGNKVYFHNDHLGSNSITTNQAGSQVENVTYDPWGKILGAATQSKYLYTGQEHDGETGLNYYDARYYDPELRRFTQPDTIIQDVYDPQSLNRYAYARNNPLRYTDPTGHAWWDAIKNTVNQAVKAVQSFFSPPKAPAVASRLPASSIPYRGPINSPSSGNRSGNSTSTSSGSSGGGNSGSSSNNGNITNTHVGLDPRFSSAYIKGHVAQSFSIGIGAASFNVGQKISKGVTTPTAGLSVGLSFPIGFSQKYSDKPVKQESLDYSISASYGPLVESGFNPSDILNSDKWSVEDGEGCCGFEIGVQYTGIPRPEAPGVYSKPIETIYNRARN